MQTLNICLLRKRRQGNFLLHVTKLEIFLKTTKLVSAIKIALLKALCVLQLSIGSALKSCCLHLWVHLFKAQAIHLWEPTKFNKGIPVLSLCFTDSGFLFCFFFLNKLKVCGNPAQRKSTDWLHFSNSFCSLDVSVSYFGNSGDISKFFIIIMLVICDQLSLMLPVIVVGHHSACPCQVMNLTHKWWACSDCSLSLSSGLLVPWDTTRLKWGQLIVLWWL